MRIINQYFQKHKMFELQYENDNLINNVFWFGSINKICIIQLYKYIYILAVPIFYYLKIKRIKKKLIK